MACCAADGTCTMHDEPPAAEAGRHHPVSQPDADRCCAISERGESGPAVPVVTLPGGLSAAAGPVPQPLPAPVLPARPTDDPSHRPGAHVPRHLFLSVLLV